MAVTTFDLTPGTPVLVYLHSPREKVFGVDVGWNLPWIQGRGLYERIWFVDR